MNDKLFCPSLMCADFNHLKDEVEKLDQAGTDIFHIDVMDGQFVPNFGMGLQDIETVRAATDKPIDVHLMTRNPGEHINLFADLGVDIIYIHPEADNNALKTLEKINQRNIKSGIAINPGTSIETVKELLFFVDYVMIMTVHPGFAGQKFLSFVKEKIDLLIELQPKYNFEIFVDGAISPEKIQILGEKGIKGFVLGTSSLFNKEESFSELLNRYRMLEFSK